MYKLVILLSIVLAGCTPPPKEAWETAAVDHVCSESQMAKAQTEAKWCKENTSYFASYCYGSAILRNCSKHNN